LKPGTKELTVPISTAMNMEISRMVSVTAPKITARNNFRFLRKETKLLSQDFGSFNARD